MSIDPNNLSAATLTFNDDFNTFDTAKWGTAYPWDSGTGGSNDSNGEQEWYLKSDYAAQHGTNTYVAQNGNLDINANPTPSSMMSDTQNHPYTSGMINSADSFSQTYGYFEMRAELPAGKGVWPAFWLLPTDGSWPPEIDAMETIGSEPNTLNTTVHYGNDQSQGSATDLPGLTGDGQFHTYGVDWQPDNITWYLDGKQVYQTATPDGMDKPMYMLANLAVGGDWPGSPDGSTQFPSTMSIDYIRAYSDDPNAQAVSGGAPATGSSGTSAGTGTGSATADPTHASGTGSSTTDPTHGTGSNHGTGTGTGSAGTDPTHGTGSNHGTGTGTGSAGTDPTHAAGSGSTATDPTHASGTGSNHGTGSASGSTATDPAHAAGSGSTATDPSHASGTGSAHGTGSTDPAQGSASDPATGGQAADGSGHHHGTTPGGTAASGDPASTGSQPTGSDAAGNGSTAVADPTTDGSGHGSHHGQHGHHVDWASLWQGAGQWGHDGSHAGMTPAASADAPATDAAATGTVADATTPPAGTADGTTTTPTGTTPTGTATASDPATATAPTTPANAGTASGSTATADHGASHATDGGFDFSQLLNAAQAGNSGTGGDTWQHLLQHAVETAQTGSDAGQSGNWHSLLQDVQSKFAGLADHHDAAAPAGGAAGDVGHIDLSTLHGSIDHAAHLLHA